MPYDIAGPQKNTTAPNAQVINKGYSAIYVDSSSGDTREQIGGSAAWRYNNPGNLQYGTEAAAYAAGAIGTAVITENGRTLYRGLFPSVEAGVAAMAATLSANYVGFSIADALNAYAPPATNDTAGYISTVTAQMGVSAETTVTPANLAQFVAAIINHEGTTEGLVWTNNLPGDPNATYDKWDYIRNHPATITENTDDGDQFAWLDGGVNVSGFTTVYISSDATGTWGDALGDQSQNSLPNNGTENRY